MGIFSDWGPKYYEHGFSVMPIQPKSKKCVIKKWPEIFCKEMPAEETMAKYFKKNADDYIALACGTASGVGAVDFDYTGPFKEEIENMILGIIPPSPVSRTGSKGWVKFIQNPSCGTRHILRDGKGFLDILGQGSICLLPPSPHQVGGDVVYRWLTPSTLMDVSKQDLPIITQAHVDAVKEIAQLDNAFFHNSLHKNDRHARIYGFTVYQANFAKDMDELITRVLAYDDAIHVPDPKGPYFRDQKYLKGVSREEYCKKEVTRYVEYKKKKKLESGIEWSIGSSLDYQTKDNGFFLKVEKLNSKGEVVLDPDGGPIYKEVPDHYGLAKYLKNEHHLKSNDAHTYRYLDDYYQVISRYGLENLIINLTKEKAKPNQIDGFYKVIRGADFVSHDMLKEPDGFLNLNNGVLDVARQQLLPHSPEMFFRYKLPHNFSPEAQCPNWLEFLNFVFDKNKELIDLSAEIFGYAMAGGKPWLHKAFLLYGEGRNGKSTYIDVLNHILGKNNICSIPIQNLCKPFSVVMADGKLANIIGETTAGDVESEFFKMAVGGEDLVAAHKGFPEYSMPFYAKIFFAANKLPRFRDQTTGAYEKLCIIPFNRYIKPEERKPMMAERFLFGEAPGIINWALRGLENLLKRGRLATVSSVSEEMESYRVESDSVYDWIKSEVFIGEKDGPNQVFMLKIKAFYNNYCCFCEKSGRPALSLIGFGRRVVAELRKNPDFIFTSSRDGVCLTGPAKMPEIVNDSDVLTKKSTHRRMWYSGDVKM